jgi:murein DD-endopeptidase MepM/ murein hydrolase activator NlpD
VTLNTRRAAISFFVILIGTSGYMLLHGGGSHVDPPIEPPAQDRYDTTGTNWNDYLWPTNAGTTRTSDFAEFRATHFHAGIDISTGGKTGFDVYASRAGWLHSAYFEPGGYGWFLVLRHPDGYYTC